MTDEIIQWLENFIENDYKKLYDGFFISANFHIPHAPLDYSLEEIEALGFLSNLNPVPKSKSMDNFDQRLINITPKQIYRASIKQLDDQVGRIIDFIDQQNDDISKSTAIIFISDNGPEVKSLYFAAEGNKINILYMLYFIFK